MALETFKRKSNNQLFKFKRVNELYYLTEDNNYKHEATILKYYERVLHDNDDNNQRPSSNAKKPKSHDKYMGKETYAYQDGLG